MDIIKYDLPKNSSTSKGGSAAVYSGGVGGVSAEAMEAALAHYLRKDADDVAQGLIRFLSEQKLEGGATFGNYFAGLDGAGGKIDRNGDGELNSMMIRQSLRIGDAYLCYDKDNHALKVYGANDGVMNLYALGGVSALGQSSMQGGGGGGGTSYNRLDSWEAYDAGKAGYVLSALLGNDLNSRVTSLENGQIEGVATQEWVQSQGYLTELSAATINALGAIKIGYSANGKNYPVLLDNNNRAYVSVPWSDTTYGVFGASANGLVPMASASNKTTAETAVGNYYLCADGKFRQLPANAFNDTWRPLGTGATDACAGNDARLSDARPASDVYAWAKASTKPTYTLDEVADGSSRKLSNYLPLSGGTMTGSIKWNSSIGLEENSWNNTGTYKGLEILNCPGYQNTGAPSNYAVGLKVSAYYSFMLAYNASVERLYYKGGDMIGWDKLANFSDLASYLPLAGGTMSNTNVVTNLNADLLDGYHASNFARLYIHNSEWSDIADIPSNLDIGFHSVHVSTKEYSALLVGKDYAGSEWQIYFHPDKHYTDEVYYRKPSKNLVRTFAFTNSNVASATKLATARTIWGQSFDGSANVSGAMTGVTNVDGLLHFDTTNGYVGIGTTSPNYKLDVAGVIHSSVGIFSDGYVSALGQNTSSDERLKDVQGDINVSIDVLANAPSKLFEWKGNKALGAQVGTIAQYWQKTLPQVVHDRGDGYLSMQYDVAALLGTITIAKRVQNHEERIKELERENDALREQLKELKG